jgi:branched-chain amino acid transport system substrate-binding protein
MRRTVTAFAAVALLAAAGCSSEIKIGAIVPETGFADDYGKRVKNGLDLALEEINGAGGIAGSPVSVIYRDDGSRPETGRQAAVELIDEEGVHMIIGAVTSAVTLEIAPLCEKKRIVLLSPTASSPKITDAGDYIYRNYPSDILEGTSMADFARDIGLGRVAIFAANDDFGVGLRTVFTQKYENRFREVVETFEFDPEDTSNYDDIVRQVAELDVDGIYIIGYVNSTGELMNRLDAAGVKALIMGTGSITGEIVQLAGGSAEHLVYPQPPFDVDSPEPEIKSFVDAYLEAYGELPDTFAAHAYDALKIAAAALEKVDGSTHPSSIREGLNGISNFKGASGDAGFDGNGDVVQYPRLFIIHQGQPIPYQRFVEQGGSLEMREG